jgi:hypothetical protein
MPDFGHLLREMPDNGHEGIRYGRFFLETDVHQMFAVSIRLNFAAVFNGQWTFLGAMAARVSQKPETRDWSVFLFS